MKDSQSSRDNGNEKENQFEHRRME